VDPDPDSDPDRVKSTTLHYFLPLTGGLPLPDQDRNRHPGHADPDPANPDRYQFEAHVPVHISPENFYMLFKILEISVADPDPDPHVFGPPGSGSTSQRYGSGSGSF
jgi:hypothetical protein